MKMPETYELRNLIVVAGVLYVNAVTHTNTHTHIYIYMSI
jgi:hypothetical protein